MFTEMIASNESFELNVFSVCSVYFQLLIDQLIVFRTYRSIDVMLYEKDKF